MDFSLICRTCLSTQWLNPIFEENDDNSYSSGIFLTIGLKIEKNDGLPQQICKPCKQFLDKALVFRTKCKNAESTLLNMKEALEAGISIKSEPIKSRKKRKRSKDIVETCIIIEDKDACEKEGVIPLNPLYLTNENDAIKPSVIAVDAKEQEIKDKFVLEVNNDTDPNSVIVIEDESDYETEFLDLSFDFDSEMDKHLMKDDIFTNENVTLENGVKIVKPETKNHESDIKIPKARRAKCTKKTNATNRKYVTNEAEKTLNDLENMPFILKNTNRVICKICQKELSRRSIDAHMTSRHPGADVRKVKCDLCDKFVMKRWLYRHRQLKHYINNCFQCLYCKIDYNSKELLLQHVVSCEVKMKQISNTEKSKEERVECDICKKTMQKASLKMHKNIKHAGMGPVCEHCGQRFGNKFRMNEHMRAKHGYDKYKCSMCDFLSASTMAIKNHERRHRGEKPFICQQCGAKFHAPHLLRQHCQSHRTEKLMKCDKCPASFKANNSLHMHKSTCHDNNSYECPLCPRTFKSRHYVVKHMRAMHLHSGPVPALFPINSM